MSASRWVKLALYLVGIGVLGGNPSLLCAQVTLPENACPSDHVDGPLHADGIAWYGTPARNVVENFLRPPSDSYGRVDSGTQNVDPATLRILTDRTDAAACRRLSYYMSNQTSYAHDGHSIYFTAGGFYFVAQWQPAMALSHYRMTPTPIMVFDSNFNLLGVYSS